MPRMPLLSCSKEPQLLVTAHQAWKSVDKSPLGWDTLCQRLLSRGGPSGWLRRVLAILNGWEGFCSSQAATRCHPLRDVASQSPGVMCCRYARIFPMWNRLVRAVLTTNVDQTGTCPKLCFWFARLQHSRQHGRRGDHYPDQLR